MNKIFTYGILITLLSGLNIGYARPSESPRKAALMQVYQDLVNAFSDGRSPPELVLISSVRQPQLVANFRPGIDPRIEVSEKVYELCREFGKDSLNAMALILSHELAHFYRGHEWCASFANRSSGGGDGGKQASFDEKETRRLETEADYFGGIYSRIAGYQTMGIMPDLIDLIYDSYSLQDKIPGYPGKEERKQAYQETVAELSGMMPVFEAAEVLFALGWYEEAALCYDRLLKKFPSREIFNNLAASYLARAISLYEKKDLPFAYPIEQDARSRLAFQETRGARPGSQKKEIEVLLTQARKQLQLALLRDPAYVTALLNLACVFDLEGDAHSAIGTANRLLKLQPQHPNALMIRGIAQYHLGMEDKAMEDLALAKSLGASFAAANLTLMQKSEDGLMSRLETYWESYFAETNANTIPLLNPKLETIEGQNPTDIDLGSLVPITLSLSPSLNLFTDNCQRMQLQRKDSSLRIIGSSGEYPLLSAQGIGIGSTADALKVSYGIPDKVKLQSEGEMWIFRRYRMIFVLEEGKVQRWTLYDIKEGE